MNFSDLNDCKEEIERLQNALKEATREKYDAGQYGLKLLDEKQTLQAKLEESEEKIIHLQLELQSTQEVGLILHIKMFRNMMSKLKFIGN